MLHDFTYRFQKVYKSCPLFLVVLHGLIGTLLHSSILKVLTMIVFEVETKILDTKIFPQHTTTAWVLALHFLICSVRRSLFRERKDTHTHTHTHTYQCQVFHKVPCDDVLQESFHSLKPVHYEISIGEEEETDDTVNDNDFDETVTMSSTSAMA